MQGQMNENQQELGKIHSGFSKFLELYSHIFNFIYIYKRLIDS